MVAVAIFTEGLYPNNFSFMKFYRNPKPSYFEYFYAVMRECFRYKL